MHADAAREYMRHNICLCLSSWLMPANVGPVLPAPIQRAVTWELRNALSCIWLEIEEAANMPEDAYSCRGCSIVLSLFPVLMHSLLLPSRMLRLCCCACSLQAAQSALEARNARYKIVPLRQSTDDSDDEEISDRVKDRLEQAERAVEKFVTRRLKAVQPGLEKVNTLPF